jgi:hypothetical protein
MLNGLAVKFEKDTMEDGWFRDGGGNGDSDWSGEEGGSEGGSEGERQDCKFVCKDIDNRSDDNDDSDDNDNDGDQKEILELAELELVLGQQLVKARQEGESEVFLQLSSDLRKVQLDLKQKTAQNAARQVKRRSRVKKSVCSAMFLPLVVCWCLLLFCDKWAYRFRVGYDLVLSLEISILICLLSCCCCCTEACIGGC